MPRWERVDAAAGAVFDEAGDAIAALQQGFEQTGELIAFVAGEPGFRDFAEDTVHDLFREVFDAFEPGGEVSETANLFVNDGTEEEAEEGSVAKFPIGAVEEIAVIHHLGDEGDLEGISRCIGAPIGETGAEEDGLAGVGVAGPFVESEDAEEVFGIGDLLHERVGEDIVHRLGDGIAGEAGAEVPAGGDSAAGGAELDIDVGVFAEEIGGDLDDAGFGLGDVEMLEKDGGDVLVHKYATVLRIVRKFDDVVVTVGSFHEEGLSSSAHAAQRATGENGHLSLV